LITQLLKDLANLKYPLHLVKKNMKLKLKNLI